MSRGTLAVIVGNRGFFPDSVAQAGREEILSVLNEEGFEPICLSPEETRFGTVDTFQDAKACAELFQRHASRINGILVTLPNFGDERGIANSIKLSGLNVPVLVHAYPDDLSRFAIGSRRDSFCGKLSVCSNLNQYKIPFTLTKEHTVNPTSSSFREELQRFGATCRVVRGLRHARIGAVGVRPASFNSVRYSERILEANGISVEVVDLVEILRQVDSLSDSEPAVTAKLSAIEAFISTGRGPRNAFLAMAKLGVVLDQWIEENEISAVAIQCWTNLQHHLGVMPCVLMSMMGSELLPSACEVDVAGLVGMYALQLASGSPSAIVDWNNNYKDDPDKCVLFHCSNYPKEFYETSPTVDRHEILSAVLPINQTWGTLQGRIKAGPVTLLRVSTDDTNGTIESYIAEGALTNDAATTWGGIGVVQIPRLQQLLNYMCKRNFEHHVAINLSNVAGSVVEAVREYLGWNIYAHACGDS